MKHILLLFTVLVGISGSVASAAELPQVIHQHGPEVKYPVFDEYENHYVFKRYWFRGDVTKSEPIMNQLVVVRKGTVVSYEFDWRRDSIPGTNPEEHELDERFRPDVPRNSRFYVHLTLTNGQVVTIGAITTPEYAIDKDAAKLFGMGGGSQDFFNRLVQILTDEKR